MGERTAHDTISTARWTENPGTTRREVIFRRSVIIGMGALVGAAALGVLGPKQATTDDSRPHGDLSVVHPQVMRPGLESEIEVTLTPAASTDTASLTLPQDALAVLGVSTVRPAPSSEVARDGAVTYEFGLADEEELTVTFSGRVPVKQGPGRTRWWVEWPADGPGDPARTRMTTWVLP